MRKGRAPIMLALMFICSAVPGAGADGKPAPRDRFAETWPHYPRPSEDIRIRVSDLVEGFTVSLYFLDPVHKIADRTYRYPTAVWTGWVGAEPDNYVSVPYYPEAGLSDHLGERVYGLLQDTELLKLTNVFVTAPPTHPKFFKCPVDPLIRSDPELGWVPRTKTTTRYCLLASKGNTPWRVVLGFNSLDEVPQSVREAVRLMLTEAADAIIQNGSYQRAMTIPDPEADARQTIEALRQSKQDRAIRMVEEVLDYYKWFGEWTDTENGQIKRWLQWQESRCARLSDTESTSDLDCRGMRIRDFLRFGPKGIPADEIAKRKARTIGEQPPPLPFATPAPPAAK